MVIEDSFNFPSWSMMFEMVEVLPNREGKLREACDAYGV